MVQLEHVHPGGPSREPDAIAVKAVGCLRAYTTTKNRPPRRGLFQRLFGLPSSFALVQAAKEAGFPQAMVIPVSYGFARGGRSTPITSSWDIRICRSASRPSETSISWKTSVEHIPNCSPTAQ